MELRSGRRLGSLPTPGPRRRRRRTPDDMISALPDEMLHHILVRLRCARAATRTSGLSRRWRGLWRHLPELSFREISASALLAALGQVACPALSLLEVDIPLKHGDLDPARVSALFNAAARLAPADLVFRFKGYFIPIEIPCFDRAASVKLDVPSMSLTLPARVAAFPLLERLSLAVCRIDTAELVRRCPRLRVLNVSRGGIRTVKVHSATIEELAVEGTANLSNIDIVGPVLKRFSFSAELSGVAVSFSAPMVEDLSWVCFCRGLTIVGFGNKWYQRYLNLYKTENFCVLYMHISAFFPGRWSDPPVDLSFSQEIAQLPAFSVLELRLETQMHVYGALVSHLLGICSTIRSLEVSIQPKLNRVKTCSPDCDCDQPQNWRNEIISLTTLEEVKVKGLGGTSHEVDFLSLLFRCAPSMKQMVVVWAPEFLPTFQDCLVIYDIFWANPNINCSVYRGHRKH